jgi:hypothetical protein
MVSPRRLASHGARLAGATVLATVAIACSLPTLSIGDPLSDLPSTLCFDDAGTSSTTCMDTVAVTTTIDTCSDAQHETRTDCAALGQQCRPTKGCVDQCSSDGDCPFAQYCSQTEGICVADLVSGSCCTVDAGPPCSPGLECLPGTTAEDGGIVDCYPASVGTGVCRPR